MQTRKLGNSDLHITPVGGRSEIPLRIAILSRQWPRPYVFTKCGLRWDAKGNMKKALRSDSIRREVEDSLRRLSVEVIDL